MDKGIGNSNELSGCGWMLTAQREVLRGLDGEVNRPTWMVSHRTSINLSYVRLTYSNSILEDQLLLILSDIPI